MQKNKTRPISCCQGQFCCSGQLVETNSPQQPWKGFKFRWRLPAACSALFSFSPDSKEAFPPLCALRTARLEPDHRTPSLDFLHNVIVLNVILKELRHLSKSLGACNETFQLAAVLFYFFLLFWRRLSQFWACCLVPKSSLGLGWILQDCGVTYSAE